MVNSAAYRHELGGLVGLNIRTPALQQGVEIAWGRYEYVENSGLQPVSILGRGETMPRNPHRDTTLGRLEAGGDGLLFHPQGFEKPEILMGVCDLKDAPLSREKDIRGVKRHTVHLCNGCVLSV